MGGSSTGSLSTQGGLSQGLANGIAQGFQVGMAKKQFATEKEKSDLTIQALKKQQKFEEDFQTRDPSGYANWKMRIKPEDALMMTLAKKYGLTGGAETPAAPTLPAPGAGMSVGLPDGGEGSSFPQLAAQMQVGQIGQESLPAPGGMEGGPLAGLLDSTEGRTLFKMITGMDPDKAEPTTFPVDDMAGPGGAPVAARRDRAGNIVGRSTPKAIKPEVRSFLDEATGRQMQAQFNPYTNERIGEPWVTARPGEGERQLADGTTLGFKTDASGNPVPGSEYIKKQPDIITVPGAIGPGGQEGVRPGVNPRGGGFIPTANEQTQRPFKAVPAEDLGKYIGTDGKPPRGAWTYGALDSAVNSGDLKLKDTGTAGESEKKIGLLGAATYGALDSVEQALFGGDKYNAGLLKQAELVPKGTGGLSGAIAKGQRLTGTLGEATRYVQDTAAALEPVGRLLSGGVISKDEEARFRQAYLPQAGDDQARAFEKLQRLRRVYAALESATDPNGQRKVIQEAIGKKTEGTGGGAKPNRPGSPGEKMGGWTFQQVRPNVFDWVR